MSIESSHSPTDHSSDQILRGLREVVLLVFFTIAIFILLSLVTFSLEDAGWSHSGSGQSIHNAGGIVGAWLSDFILSVFGVMAYLFPIMIGYHGFLIYKRSRRDEKLWILLLRWLGFAATLISGAALAYTHFVRPIILLPGTSGGIMGQEIGEWLIMTFGVTGASLLMLATFICGATLFAGISWLAFIDLLGKYTLFILRHSYRMGARLMERIGGSRRQDRGSVVAPLIRTESVSTVKPTKTEPVLAFNEALLQPSTESFSLPKKLPEGTLPSLSLLDEIKHHEIGYSELELETMSRQVEIILSDFGVIAEVVEVRPGPVITRFEIEPAAGVKASRISALSRDMARKLSVHGVRVVEVIPGKTVIGLEIPNQHRETVYLREVFASKQYNGARSPLTLVLGKDIAGVPVVADLAKMPHLLVAGTTGSGKSVAVNAMILSILFKAPPEQVRLIMIDPKMLELSVYEGIPHLLTPVVTDMKEAANALRWCVAEMERRYKLMSMLGVRNLTGYNKKVNDAIADGSPIKDPLFRPEVALEEGQEHPVLEPLTNIVIIIDELADMMMIVGKKVEELIARLAQKARAAGLHLILATQRPSVDVLTGLIKANIPTRIAFQVSSKIDSRTILDQAGAETLLGNGDMLFLPPGTSMPQRAHGAFVADHEVHKAVYFLKQTGSADYLDEITRDRSDSTDSYGVSGEPGDETDPLYDEAIQIVTESRKASISYVQRRLKVGYNRAARMIEDMEKAGVVSSAQATGNREVLAPPPPEN